MWYHSNATFHSVDFAPFFLTLRHEITLVFACMAGLNINFAATDFTCKSVVTIWELLVVSLLQPTDGWFGLSNYTILRPLASAFWSLRKLHYSYLFLFQPQRILLVVWSKSSNSELFLWHCISCFSFLWEGGMGRSYIRPGVSGEEDIFSFWRFHKNGKKEYYECKLGLI